MLPFGSPRRGWIHDAIWRSGAAPFMLIGLLLSLSRTSQASDASCSGSGELRRSGHMNVGVRLDIPNAIIREEFEYAMDFWASVVDMEWHRDAMPNCAISITYGAPELFDTDDFAQAEDPDSEDFRGEIAFNPAFDMTPREAYLVSIHEVGHLLGLDHNPSPTSVMCPVGLEGSERLELVDIAALSARHRLRQMDFPVNVPAAIEITLPAIASIESRRSN